MDEKTVGIIIMGLIVIGLGAFASWMDWKQKSAPEHDDRQRSLI